MDKLSLVHPLFAERVRQLFQKLKEEGYDFIVTQGLRTWEEQNALYAKGRTAPGPVVTKAPGGHSQHNFGLAVDVAPNGTNGKYSAGGIRGVWAWFESLCSSQN